MIEIKLHPAACLNEVGKRENNEDSIFPSKGESTANDKIFLVCDGVGGSKKGEEASRLACETFVKYCQQNPIAVPDVNYINAAVKQIEAAFDARFIESPDQKGMGTTFTMACFHNAGITVAHIGDSRVYHVRDGAIMWQTDDHSLVNDYVKAGILDKKDAIDHPQKNVITRALQGASVRTTRADVRLITDIEAGDYIFLCTDGILESISDELLASILTKSGRLNDQNDEICNKCLASSRDNFSCYLLQISSVKDDAIIPQYDLNPITEAVVVEEAETENVAVAMPEESATPKRSTPAGYCES